MDEHGRLGAEIRQSCFLIGLMAAMVSFWLGLGLLASRVVG